MDKAAYPGKANLEGAATQPHAQDWDHLSTNPLCMTWTQEEALAAANLVDNGSDRSEQLLDRQRGAHADLRDQAAAAKAAEHETAASFLAYENYTVPAHASALIQIDSDEEVAQKWQERLDSEESARRIGRLGTII